jgi:hypothetical protein
MLGLGLRINGSKEAARASHLATLSFFCLANSASLFLFVVLTPSGKLLLYGRTTEVSTRNFLFPESNSTLRLPEDDRLEFLNFKLLFLGPGLVAGRVSTSPSTASSSSSSLYAMRLSTTLGEKVTLDPRLLYGRGTICERR